MSSRVIDDYFSNNAPKAGSKRYRAYMVYCAMHNADKEWANEKAEALETNFERLRQERRPNIKDSISPGAALEIMRALGCFWEKTEKQRLEKLRGHKQG